MLLAHTTPSTRRVHFTINAASFQMEKFVYINAKRKSGRYTKKNMFAKEVKQKKKQKTEEAMHSLKENEIEKKKKKKKC